MSFAFRALVLTAVVVACGQAAPTARAEEEKWVSLFDGKSLAGWERNGS